MRYLSENKREDMRMKKRTAARSMETLQLLRQVLLPEERLRQLLRVQKAGRSQKQISLSVRRRILLRLILRDNRIRLRVC